MTIRNRRRALRAAVVTAATASAFGLAAATAWAKADSSFTAGPHTVRLGATVHLAGQGDDDNSTYNRFCVQERFGAGHWVTLRCSHGGYNAGGSVDMRIRPSHRGQWQFRGVLTEASSPRDRHQTIIQATRTVTVHVR
ncbi:hypothetical protein [Streptacidiphilus monticola]|uniref:Secreted protein n=1 Tax=Streptacidiphilus monticola TaxID=2161674 RepID=A0ABW1G6Q1_9ACTN